MCTDLEFQYLWFRSMLNLAWLKLESIDHVLELPVYTESVRCEADVIDEWYWSCL